MKRLSLLGFLLILALAVGIGAYAAVGLGVEGSIVGKALYAGAFTLREALAAVAT